MDKTSIFATIFGIIALASVLFAMFENTHTTNCLNQKGEVFCKNIESEYRQDTTANGWQGSLYCINNNIGSQYFLSKEDLDSCKIIK